VTARFEPVNARPVRRPLDVAGEGLLGVNGDVLLGANEEGLLGADEEALGGLAS